MRKPSLLAAALLPLAIPSIAAVPGPTVLPLEQFRKSIGVRVNVAGQQRLFQLDTGGGVTFIAPSVAKTLGCEKGARLVGFRMTGDKMDTPRCENVAIRIGGKPLKIPIAGVADLGELNAKGVSVDGSIALDAFAGKTITIDFAALKLFIETPKSAKRRVLGATELPVRLVREVGGHALAVDVQVPTQVGTLGFQVDSGNGGTILVSKHYAALFGINPDKGPQRGSLRLADGIKAEGLIFPADITLDGNLGMPFLKNYVVTLDLAKGRLWVSRNQTPAPAGMGEPPVEPKT